MAELESRKTVNISIHVYMHKYDAIKFIRSAIQYCMIFFENKTLLLVLG